MAQPLLSICIPAYKRPDQLRRCLASIVRSIRAADISEVVIHVTDDSCDGTNDAVLEEAGRDYPLLQQHRNPQNLGIDRNILHCVDVSAARYAWIMGEDDRMTPEAVATVLPLLRRSEAPLVYVNYASVDENVSLVLSERSLPLDQDVELDANTFCANCAWSMGFIGACVVRKDGWSAARAERYVGTYFAHAGRILEAVRGQRISLVARSLVLNRCGTPRAFTWAGSTFDVLGGWRRMVDLLRDVYPQDVCDAAAASFSRAHAIGSLRSFSYLRADGVFDAQAHEKYVRNGPYPALNRRLAWLVARTPTHVFRALRWGLMAVRRGRNRRISGY